MKILFVSHSSGSYGAERSLISVVKELRKRNYEITVAVPRVGPLTSELRSVNVPFIIWPYRLWIGKKYRFFRGLFRTPFNFFSAFIFSLINAERFDLIYTNTIATNFGALISLFSGKPHVWHVREFVHEDSGADFDVNESLLKYLFLKNLHVAIYNSNAVEKKFKNYLGSHESVVVPNGLDLNNSSYTFEPKVRGRYDYINVLMVASLKKEKGHFDALKAIAALVPVYPNIVLNIIGGGGDPNYLSKLKDFIISEAISNNVKFLGYLSDPLSKMYESDVFLMCSENEAFGRVTVEAMSVGCPVIGTNSGGTAEIIENNVTGLLYQPGDCEGLAKKLDFLISDFELRKNISKNGYNLSKRFSVSNCVDGIESVI